MTTDLHEKAWNEKWKNAVFVSQLPGVKNIQALSHPKKTMLDYVQSARFLGYEALNMHNKAKIAQDNTYMVELEIVGASSIYLVHLEEVKSCLQKILEFFPKLETELLDLQKQIQKKPETQQNGHWKKQQKSISFLLNTQNIIDPLNRFQNAIYLYTTSIKKNEFPFAILGNLNNETARIIGIFTKEFFIHMYDLEQHLHTIEDLKKELAFP